jgi:hypothetical protein
MGAVIQAGTVAGAVIAITAALALLWRGFIKAVESAVGERIDRVIQQQYEQDGDFNEIVAAVQARLEGIESCLRDVRSQVFPNSGSSLRDRVDELHAMVAGS